MRPKFHSGFTLIELSIVLVIIGLLVGGVLVGRDLIEAARLRSIVSAHQDFAVRWQTFRLKYNCLPGDCANATRFFSEAPACPAVTATGTCNGSGDGWIHWSSSPSEAVLVWNHFYLSGLGNFTGMSSAGNPGNIWSVHYARAPNKHSTTGWFLGGTSTGYAQMYPSTANDNNGSSLQGTGLQTARANSAAQGSQPRVAIEPAHVVRDIDVKMDDGIPAMGKFRASGGRIYDTATTLTCITGSHESSAYDLTQTDPTCRYIYSIQ